MLPISHTDLVVILAFTIAITVTGFSFMTYLIYRFEQESKRSFAEMSRMTTAVAALVYQEEEKTRALLREHRTP